MRCTLGIARGPVPFLGLTPGTDITTIMEFYSLAEAFVKSERAARHFVLPQDRLCLAAFALSHNTGFLFQFYVHAFH